MGSTFDRLLLRGKLATKVERLQEAVAASCFTLDDLIPPGLQGIFYWAIQQGRQEFICRPCCIVKKIFSAATDAAQFLLFTENQLGNAVAF